MYEINENLRMAIENAPYWCQCIAQDSSGDWLYHELPPVLMEEAGYWGSLGDMEHAFVGENSVDWEVSLIDL